MDPINFTDYFSSFLTDPKKSELLFYKSKNQNYSFKELIQSAVSISNFLKNSQDTFFALQMDSSYDLFCQILAGIMANKEMLILSDKEPKSAVKNYQKEFNFDRVIRETVLNPVESSFPKIEISGNKTAFSILSSGSSGPSKKIPLSLNNVYYSAEGIIEYFQMTSKDTTFLNLPHHHIGGLMILWRAFFSGSSVTTSEDENYQFISLVPLQLKRFINDPVKKIKLQNCRGVLIGGAPVDEHLKKEALKSYIPIYETYGMSETSSLVLLNGRPMKNQAIKLDPHGYFLIKGKTLSSLAPVDEEGFFHTKDIGVRKSDGSYDFLSRGDLLFKSAGELINPLVIEAKAKDLDWISEAVIVPIKHSEWTMASALIYQSIDPKKNVSEIKDHFKKELHPHQIPRYFFEAPKTMMSAGIKAKRFEISKWAQEQYFKELFHYQYVPHENAKKIVLFLHGFMEDQSDMMVLMDNHKEASFLFIDLPGHGKTTFSKFKSRQNFFDELLSLLNFSAQKLPIILYGYSMGGRVALELCMMGLKPETLILESSSFGLVDENEKKNRLDLDRKLFSNVGDLKDFFDVWYKNPIFGNYNQSSYFKIDIEKKISHNYHDWQSSLEFLSPGSSGYSLLEVIEKLKALNIVGIYGSLDKKYKKHFQEMQSQFKNLELHEIIQAGHNPHKTHLIEVKKILGQYI